MAELEIKPTAAIRMRVLALICAAIGISAVLMYLLIGGTADFFARSTTLTTYMPDSGGIGTDSEVRLSGIRIGKVTKVDLSGSRDPERIVRIEMRVLTRYLRSIPSDSQTDVNQDTMVADPFVDIAEGKSPVPLPEDGVLRSQPIPQATDRADLIRNLQESLAQADQILAQMSSPNTKIGNLVVGEAAYDTILSKISAFDRALHTFLSPGSDLGKALFSLDLYTHIHDIAATADRTLASIQSGEGTAGRLFADDGQYVRFVREIAELRASLAEAGAGKGKFGPLLHDDESYRRITRLLAATDAALASFNSGEGPAGGLLANAQLYRSLNGSLRSMEALLRDLHENPQKYLRYKLF